MRIPWAKVYRAFPELDRFADEDCERFVRIARKRFRGEAGLVLPLQIVATVIALVVASVLAMRWMSLTEIRWSPLISTVPSAVLIGGALLPAVLIRDAWLRSMLRRHIGNVQCAGCGYSLLGLPVTPAANSVGTTRCPECGGLALRTDSRCEACGYVLAGLPVAFFAGSGGTVLCPECGRSTSLDERGLTSADLLSDRGGQGKASNATS